MSGNAIVLTGGLLATSDAKTAHGLIRFSERFLVKAIVDEQCAGKDAGEVVDGVNRNIPVYETLSEALDKTDAIEFVVVGIAPPGGKLPDSMLATIKVALTQSISIVSGLHDYLNDKPELVSLAQQHRAQLIDVRRPKQRSELHFWTGEVKTITAPIVAVQGTDCAIGKRTTARMLVQACEQAGINAQMIYTGQTGWLQGGKYGFIFDSTLNDFTCGELEHALVSCWKETNADVLIIEGQAALRNPSGPCGSEMLVSGNAKHVIIVHAPKRRNYGDDAEWGAIPSIESEIELIRMYGCETIAVALNTSSCTLAEAEKFQQEYSERLGLPVLLPVEKSMTPLVPHIKKILQRTNAEATESSI